MSTTSAIIDFAPTPLAPFQFQATFDGAIYTVIVTWNLYGRRWYVNIYTLQRVLVVSIAMAGSPVDYDISLTAGYFTTRLVYRALSNQFEVIEP